MAFGPRSFALLPVLLALAGCPGTNHFVPVPDDDVGTLICDKGKAPRFGQCFCVDNTGCLPTEYCELVTGECKTKPTPPGPDASFACTSGARRCSPKRAAVDAGVAPSYCNGAAADCVQECQASAWVDVQDCPAEGYCTAAASGFYCAVCNNGRSRCQQEKDDAGVPLFLVDDAGVSIPLSQVVEVCSEKGDEWKPSDCPAPDDGGVPSLCVGGRCQSCTPGEIRCSPDGKSLDRCRADGSGWDSQYCPTTIKCELSPLPVDAGDPGPALAHCVTAVCEPRKQECKVGSTTVLRRCADDGMAWEEKDCTTLDQYATPTATCKNNGCDDPCANAARNSSYIGCDYWATVTSNYQIDPVFKGNATDGVMSDAPSEFAVVVSNPNNTAVTVKVYRKKAGVEQLSPSSPPQGTAGIVVAAGQLATIKLPWSMVSQTGLLPFAYHVVSTLPISAYQFNPVSAKSGSTYSYSNDASLLIPGHILGPSYVVLGQEHITLRIWDSTGLGVSCTTIDDCPGPGNACQSGMLGKVCKNAPLLAVPAFFSVVGVQADTRVTIKFSAATLASKNGTSIAAQAKNSIASYTLQPYDVLQFWSEYDGNGTNPAQCYTYPTPANGYFDQVCRWNSDPTGTVVLAAQLADPTKPAPVAVFSGADCTFKPYNKFACDHIEEMMLPFSTWGQTYAGLKTVPYKTSSGSPVSNPSPDYWRVVGGCGKASCAAGTTFTITPAPGTIIQSQYCTTSGGKSVCTLPPIDPASSTPTAAWLEFTHAGDFTVLADRPIMLSQYFTGEEANTDSAEGDPSLVLTPPVEQWRNSYTVLTAPSMAHNYLSLVTSSAVPAIMIDNKALNTTNFSGMTSKLIPAPGGYVTYKVPVSGGTHSIAAGAKLGVTIYGYDSYVSYGYTGGLDLTQITQIIPGG